MAKINPLIGKTIASVKFHNTGAFAAELELWFTDQSEASITIDLKPKCKGSFTADTAIDDSAVEFSL